jgi:hypothetical protein
MSTDKDKVVGHIEIRELRDKYEPNYNVFILTDKEIPEDKLGEFNPYDWEYALYFDEREIIVYSIEKARTLPKSLNTLVTAVRELYPDEIVFSYVIKLWSSLNKQDVECDINEWLEDEGYRIKGIEVIRLSKVKKRKRISITESMFEKMLKKISEK